MDDPGKDEYDNATTGQDPLMRYVEMRRHTDNEGDRLTPRGAADAEMIGRDRLHPAYAAFVSTGAARASQMLEILRHAAGQDATPITPAPGLRSSVENRWRPPMTMAASVTTMRVLPGVAPRPDWPGGAETAVGLPGTALLGAHGGSAPVPIASLAKIMTAYVVLSGYPLPAAGSVPVITVTAADAAAYAGDQRQGRSVVKVAAGETLTERQALEAMLIPSGNNIASLAGRLGRGLGRGVRGEDQQPLGLGPVRLAQFLQPFPALAEQFCRHLKHREIYAETSTRYRNLQARLLDGDAPGSPAGSTSRPAGPVTYPFKARPAREVAEEPATVIQVPAELIAEVLAAASSQGVIGSDDDDSVAVARFPAGNSAASLARRPS